MKKYLWPLLVFCGLNLVLLIIALFMPAIGATGDQLVTDTSAHASTFWGWSWASGNLKLLVWVIAELVIMFLTFKAFLATKKR